MVSFSAHNRPALLGQLKQHNFDLVVIGGGITGAGIALDAVSRGLTVALVEMQDFAAGTSSRSTRLIHGGLRYLQQFEFGLVSEVGREREIIHHIAPHLVKPMPILLPLSNTGLNKLVTRLGMRVYEYLAGVKKEERHRVLTAKEIRNQEPLLHQRNLAGGILYYEYMTDDARLTISVLKTAVQRGLLALSYLKATGFIYENGNICGVETKDQMSEETYTIRASYVVNAAGPWVDEVDRLDPGTNTKLQHTKGVHLVFDHDRLPLKQSIYFQTPDKRMVFAIPHLGKTYVGTTDTFYNGDLANPSITEADKDYLLNAVNKHFKAQWLSSSDILSGWAGIRPLVSKSGKKPSEISRKDEIFESDTGLISIAGGKLTAYRKMGQRVVDLLGKKMLHADKRKVPACGTDKILLAGADVGTTGFTAFGKQMMPGGITLGLETHEIEMLLDRYGSGTTELFAILDHLRKKEGLQHSLPLLMRGELLYAIEHEMCLTPLDFFVRRTGMLYFEIESVIKHKTDLVAYMKDALDWDDTSMEKYAKDLLEAIANIGDTIAAKQVP